LRLNQACRSRMGKRRRVGESTAFGPGGAIKRLTRGMVRYYV
jgi:hypothetical protein